MKDAFWRLIFGLAAFVMAVNVIHRFFTGKDVKEAAVFMLLCYITSLLFRER